MDPIIVLAALASAITHAAWNAAARMRADPGMGFAVVVYSAAVPSAIGLPFVGLPSPAALPYLVAGILFNTISMRALMSAYRRAPFSVAFPVARGLTPLFVVFAAAAFLGEAMPRPMVLAGIALISCALLALASESLRRREVTVMGLAMAALSSLFAAGYVMMDASGVRAAGGILPYAFTIAIANAVALGALSALEGHRPWQLPAREWRFGLLACTVSMTSYMLVLYAFSRGNLGPVSALRETSVLFATAFAALVLKERVGRVEWLSAALAVCGIAMIRLG